MPAERTTGDKVTVTSMLDQSLSVPRSERLGLLLPRGLWFLIGTLRSRVHFGSKAAGDEADGRFESKAMKKIETLVGYSEQTFRLHETHAHDVHESKSCCSHFSRILEEKLYRH